MNIGVAILIIASNIISKRVVLGSLLMVGFRVMGSMISWGGHMVGRGSVNHWSRGIGGGRGVCRGRCIGGRRSIGVTAIGSSHEGQGNKSLQESLNKFKSKYIC